MLIFVTPASGHKVYLSQLSGAIPSAGVYVTKNKEIERYLKAGILVKKDESKKAKK